jgi:hypothetical protein
LQSAICNLKSEINTMSITSIHRMGLVALTATALCAASGCGLRNAWMHYQRPSPGMLGVSVDQYNEPQEHNAEAAKYIVYQHEFELNRYEDGDNVGGYRLNEAGEDHIKKISFNLRRGSPYQVVVERSQTTVKPGTQFEYPIHQDPELDSKRRQVVVRALTKMGIPNADEIVVVAPSFAQPYTSAEAEASYERGISPRTLGNGGLGGFGGFGGFGGGFF